MSMLFRYIGGALGFGTLAALHCVLAHWFITPIQIRDLMKACVITFLLLALSSITQCRAWLVLATVGVSQSLFAAEGLVAPPVPASSLQDHLQQERERALRNQMDQSQDLRLPRTAISASAEQFPENETPCFTITRIVLVGESAVTPCLFPSGTTPDFHERKGERR